jgi:hypothetical protein
MELDYSYIDYDFNQPTPPPMKNAGLYTDDNTFSKKAWGNDYIQPRVPPDAASYAAQFYAKNHIPSYQHRPGNNNVKSNYIKPYDNPNYNLNCYNNS